ncbi:MAG TPA: hypothetical protein VJZ75_08595 [Candidatus Bathyarchaeia archaeon]|nr:hypothetical protein [Candidatus Bathyarchaeia archaeon]
MKKQVYVKSDETDQTLIEYGQAISTKAMSRDSNIASVPQAIFITTTVRPVVASFEIDDSWLWRFCS